MVSASGLKSMKVIHVIKVTSIAGAENHLLVLVAGLRARQIDAQIIMLTEPNKPMIDFITAAKQREIPIRSVVIRRMIDFSLIQLLRDFFREAKPDIVHTHLQHADLHGITAARWAKVPVVITSRHNDNTFRRRPPIKQLNYALWRLVNAGIAISKSIARFATEVEGAPTQKVHTIYYGLPFTPNPVERESTRQAIRQELGIGKDDLVVGMVCRLVEQKGVGYGLHAFSQVVGDFSSARLVIVGDGPLRRSLETLINPLGLRGYVQFLGWRADVPRVMAAFDVLLVPSLWEGFGLVILEAMARRVPAIGSDVSAIPEIIAHGETGLLTPPRDIGRLAEALHLLLSDHALRRHMGLLAEDRLEANFSESRMVNQTLALYDRLLADRKRW
jgi:glycosyltransferase involved in cell wall biosynthesis